jgi:predicted transcriptional regulator
MDMLNNQEAAFHGSVTPSQESKLVLDLQAELVAQNKAVQELSEAHTQVVKDYNYLVDNWKSAIQEQIKAFELFTNVTFTGNDSIIEDLEDYGVREVILNEVDDHITDSDFEDAIEFDFDFSHWNGQIEISTNVSVKDDERISVIEKIVYQTIDAVVSKLKEGHNG